MSTHPIPTFATPRTATGTFLRRALQLDAIVTGTNGLAYLIAANPLSSLFDVDALLLRAIGAFLLAFAAGVAYLSTREAMPTTAVWTVIALNALWTIESLLFAAFDVATPSTTGTIWTLLQAVTVLGFAALQTAALRRG